MTKTTITLDQFYAEIAGGRNDFSDYALAEGTTYLDCSGNQLAALPVIPASLIYLYCWGNRLKGART